MEKNDEGKFVSTFFFDSLQIIDFSFSVLRTSLPLICNLMTSRCKDARDVATSSHGDARCRSSAISHLSKLALKRKSISRMFLSRSSSRRRKSTIPNNTHTSPTVSPPCVTGGFNGRFPTAKRLTGDSVFKGGRRVFPEIL